MLSKAKRPTNLVENRHYFLLFEEWRKWCMVATSVTNNVLLFPYLAKFVGAKSVS